MDYQINYQTMKLTGLELRRVQIEFSHFLHISNKLSLVVGDSGHPVTYVVYSTHFSNTSAEFHVILIKYIIVGLQPQIEPTKKRQLRSFCFLYSLVKCENFHQSRAISVQE